MKPTDRPDSSFSRRQFLQTAAAAGAAITTGGAVIGAQGAEAEVQPQLISQENLKEGSRDWQLTRVRLDEPNGFRNSDIEGYCSKQSVRAGEIIDIMVSVKPAADFVIEIFRTGYYAGRGRAVDENDRSTERRNTADARSGAR